MRTWLAIWITAGLAAGSLVGCGEDAKPAAKPDAAATDTAGGDTSSDASSDDAAADATAGSDAEASDSEAPPEPPSVATCAALAKTACTAAADCCTTQPSGCEAHWKKACGKLLGGLDDALLASALTLPADPTACANGVAAAAKACDAQGIERALNSCLLAYTDTAAVGQPCSALAPVGCGAGAGRCDPKGPAFYQCQQAVGEGDACKLSQPCALGLECLNTNLTRALVCGIPGSTCNLGDACWDGWRCDQGSCVQGDEPGKKAKGEACSADADCQGTLLCQQGKCAPKVCAL